MVRFFVVEAASQTSTALGFAVLEIPDDVRLCDGGAELSADVTSPDGRSLEGVTCVADLKVIRCIGGVLCIHPTWTLGLRHAYTVVRISPLYSARLRDTEMFVSS